MSSALVLLPDRDRDYLDSKEMTYLLHPHAGAVHLTFPDFDLPDLYNVGQAGLRIILPVGYDNSHPDMFWTRPNILLRSGGFPQAADHMEELFDGTWQRWSRHLQGAWRPGVDGIRSYLGAIRRELARVA